MEFLEIPLGTSELHHSWQTVNSIIIIFWISIIFLFIMMFVYYYHVLYI